MLRDEHIGEILVQADELQHRIKEMAAEVSRDYADRDLLLIGVLKGAVFLPLSMRHLDIQCEVDFMAVACTARRPTPPAWCGSSRTSTPRSRAATS